LNNISGQIQQENAYKAKQLAHKLKRMQRSLLFTSHVIVPTDTPGSDINGSLLKRLCLTLRRSVSNINKKIIHTRPHQKQLLAFLMLLLLGK
jgi:hypothetical protein